MTGLNAQGTWPHTPATEAHESAELRLMCAVLAPVAVELNELACRDRRGMPDNGDQVPLPTACGARSVGGIEAPQGA
jgi:hypothetical protein